MSDFIKISRKMKDWGWYTNINTKAIFFHCLIRANWETRDVLGEVLNRGQFLTSLNNLAKETGVSLGATRKALKNLKKTNEINIKSTNKYSIITVCKYDNYQSPKQKNDKQTTNKRQTNDKQTTTEEELKNLRSKEIEINKENKIGEKDKIKDDDFHFLNSYKLQEKGLNPTLAQIAESEKILKLYPTTNLPFNHQKGKLAILQVMQDFPKIKIMEKIKEYAIFAKSLSWEDKKYLVHPEKFFNNKYYLQTFEPKLNCNNPNWIKFKNYYNANFCELTARQGLPEWEKTIVKIDKQILFQVMGDLLQKHRIKINKGEQSISPKLSEIVEKCELLTQNNLKRIKLKEEKLKEEKRKTEDENAKRCFKAFFDKMTLEQKLFVFEIESKEEFSMFSYIKFHEITDIGREYMGHLWKSKYSDIYNKKKGEINDMQK